ncbi:hypothetical protein D3C72_2273290 [compost metagenome]
MMSLSAMSSLLGLVKLRVGVGSARNTENLAPKTKGPLRVHTGLCGKVCACAYCLRPWGGSNRASANDFIQCNVAQVPKHHLGHL